MRFRDRDRGRFAPMDSFAWLAALRHFRRLVSQMQADELTQSERNMLRELLHDLVRLAQAQDALSASDSCASGSARWRLERDFRRRRG
jgi:hypothetical protein